MKRGEISRVGALADEANRLLRDAAARTAMARAALEFSAAHRGATGGVVELLEF